jgi:DNA-binding GntR family transcriptional regulator
MGSEPLLTNHKVKDRNSLLIKESRSFNSPKHSYIVRSLQQQQPTRDGRAEHKALTDAVLSRDSDRAVDIFRTHIQLTADNLLDNL